MVEWGDQDAITGPDRPIAGLHVGPEDDEAWYVLAARLGFRVGEATMEAGAGAVMFVPRGTPHSLFSRPEPVRYVLVMTPRIHHLVAALHGPGSESPCFAPIFREHASEVRVTR